MIYGILAFATFLFLGYKLRHRVKGAQWLYLFIIVGCSWLVLEAIVGVLEVAL